ncbi:hypothetical protein NFI96_033076, partial [Prochilodus magdalenae]
GTRQPYMLTPQGYRHHAHATVLPPPCSRHRATSTMLTPQRYLHHAHATVLLPPCSRHGATATMLTPRCYLHHAHATALPPPCSRHSATSTMLTPQRYRHHAHATALQPPCSRHSATSTMLTPQCYLHHAHATALPPPCSRHSATSTMLTPQRYLHHAHATVLPPPCSRHGATSTMLTPQGYLHHAHATALPPPCSRHSATSTMLTPQGYRHHAHATVLPPPCSRHRATATMLTPQRYRHHAHATALPPPCSRHSATSTMLTPRCYLLHAHATALPPPCSRHSATATMLTPRRYRHHAHATVLPPPCSRHSATSTMLTPRCYLHHAHATVLPPPCSRHSATSTMLTPQCYLRHAHATVLTPPCSRHSAHATMLTPQCYLHHAHATVLPPPCSRHGATSTMLTPQCYLRHAHATALPPPCSRHSATSAMLTPQCYLRHAHATVLPPPCSRHSATSAMLTPQRYRHHAHATVLPPPCSRHRATSAMLTPQGYLRHAHATVLTPPCSRHSATATMLTPRCYLHHAHATVLPPPCSRQCHHHAHAASYHAHATALPPPCSRHSATSAMLTPQCYLRHAHATVLTPPCSRHSATSAMLTPQRYRHHAHATVLPPPCSRHGATSTMLTPQGYLRHAHATGLPPPCSRHSATSTMLTPQGYRHHAHATVLPPPCSRHSATAAMLTPQCYLHHAHATVLPPPCSRHSATSAMLTPQRYLRHAHATGLPPPCSRHSATSAMLTPQGYLRHAHATGLPPPCSHHSATATMLTPQCYLRHAHAHLVAEVLEKHGLQKPIAFVRSSQSSKEEAHQLMVKLTRHIGRKIPPVSESVWRDLLQDLLDMQRNVYACLEPATCHQVFVESLLCSGREENVKLAGQLMQRSAGSQDVPVSAAFRGKATPRVAYTHSVELVLASAREYFNSSATLSDPCINLARSCLQLIIDCPPPIQEEVDLISALSRLEHFGVKVLPLQVRLRDDRLSLIKECISQCPTAYKQSTLLLELARLLRVAGDDEARRKGQVLTLLAEQALHCHDYKASYIHCQDLMAAGYSEGWDVCSQLGQCETFTRLSSRQELMAFALTHCPPANIQNLLAASSSLQTQILYQAVNYKIDPSQAKRAGDDADQQATVGVSGGSLGGAQPAALLQRTTARTMEVLTNTTLTTKAVLTAVSDSHWWKESINYLRPLHGQGSDSYRGGTEEGNAELERQGCSPFYEELLEDPYVNPIDDVYSSYDYIPQEGFAEVLLRTGKLAETKSEGQQLFPATEVLLQLANDAFPRDMTLALAYLLALPQVLDANSCFEKQPPSALSLQLAAYYYSLQIYSRLAPCFKDKCSALYRADPRELIRLVTKHVSDHEGRDWADKELEALIGQLRLYSERLTDFTQAQVLLGLGRGVDVQRFSNDNQYKKETILGLAECVPAVSLLCISVTLDESVYGISRSLAQRYSIPLWEVHMTHLEFLFTDSGLSTKDIESRTESLGLFHTLKINPEAFYTHMSKYVYPSIAGTDLQRLLYYYTLLENCSCNEYLPPSSMTTDTHVKLLKKLKAVANGLDYKKLTDEDANPLKALEPVLTSQNVLSISRMAARIPLRGGETLTPSAVHSTWLHKLFWEGDTHVLKRSPQTDQEFLHAYDTCAKYFDRLLPIDAINFLDAISFSPEAADHLSVETRTEITRRALKALKGISEKSKKRGGDDGTQSESSASNFAHALTHLQQSLSHLETLDHAFVLSLRNSQEERLQEYSRVYDLSRSEQGKVRQLAVTMALDGQPLERIEQLLTAAVDLNDLQPRSIVQEAVERSIAALSGDEDVLKDYADPLKVLEDIVRAVQADVQKGGNAVSSEDLLAWLRPFCGDDSKPVRPRIEVLQILERSFSLSDEDIRLLVFFRSQAVLKACWPSREYVNTPHLFEWESCMVQSSANRAGTNRMTHGGITARSVSAVMAVGSVRTYSHSPSKDSRLYSHSPSKDSRLYSHSPSKDYRLYSHSPSKDSRLYSHSPSKDYRLYSHSLSKDSRLYSHSPSKDSRLYSHSPSKDSRLYSHSPSKDYRLYSHSPSKDSRLYSHSPSKDYRLYSHSPSKDSRLYSHSPSKDSRLYSHSLSKDSRLYSHSPSKDSRLYSHSPSKDSRLYSHSPSQDSRTYSHSPSKDSRLYSHSPSKDSRTYSHSPSKDSRLYSHSPSKCEMKDIENEEKRYSLFLELLESSRKWEEFQHLMLLLQAWPPVTDKSRLESEHNPWVCLTSVLLTHCSGGSGVRIGNEVLDMCRSLYTSKHKLRPQCIGHISSLLLNSGLKLVALKLMAESRDEQLLKLTLDQIKGITEVSDEVCDSELLSLLLDAGLLVNLVDSALYPALVSHMLSEGRWSVEEAAAELQQAGHSTQAGALLLAHRGTHPALSTFNTALNVIRKWL